MSSLKKNVQNQIMFVMVDETDFATIESALAAPSDIKIRLYGIDHGASAATSIVSLAATKCSLVRSGIFRAWFTMNKDQVLFRASSLNTISCANQLIMFEQERVTISDVHSLLTVVGSNVSDIQSAADSQAILNASWFSDIDSAMSSQALLNASWFSNIDSAADSQAILIASWFSDVISQLTAASAILSDITSCLVASNLASRVWETDITNAKMASNVASQVWAHAIGARTDSRVSDIQSALDSQYILLASTLSNLESAADSQALLNASWFSDIDSALSSQYVKVLSQATHGASRALLNQSAISNVESALDSQYLVLSSTLSNIESAADSQALLHASWFSDIDSAMTSRWSDIHSFMSTTGVGLNASTMSDLRSAMNAASVFLQASDFSDIISAIAAGPAATITAQDISDIASRVWAVQTISDLVSKVWGETYTAYKSPTASQFGARMIYVLGSVMSAVSDLKSAVDAAATASDVASKVWAVPYSDLVTASTLGSFFHKMVDSGVTIKASDMSDLRSAIGDGPTGGVTVSNISDIASRVWAEGYATHNVAGSFGSLFRVGASNLSDTQSALDSQYILLASTLSNLESAADSQAILNASWFSDIDSALSSQYTKVYSQATGASATLSDIGSAADSQALLIASWFSDIDSAISSQYTKVYSQATGASATLSDIQSGADSQALLNASWFSDIDSALTSRFTITLSRITGTVPTLSQLQLTQSMVSDIQSVLLVMTSTLSDIDSAMTSRWSDIHSFMSTTGVGLNASTMSDLRSAITAGPAAASADSIASAVWAHATASDVYSKVDKIASRTTLMDTSILSDIKSAITAAQSDINSHVSGITATVDNASVASAVWAHAVAASLTSRVSDVQSALDSQYAKVYSAVQAGGLTASAMSDIASRVWAEPTAASLVSRVSDIQSAVDSQALLNASWFSDIDSALSSQYVKVLSQATHAASRALLNQSAISNVESALDSQYLVLTSTLSDIDSALSSQYLAGQNLNASALSDVQSRVDVCLDTAFTDATTLTSNGLKERLRSYGWVLRNKMTVNDTTGDTIVYKDDGTTAGVTVTAALTDDGTTTTRKRMV